MSRKESYKIYEINRARRTYIAAGLAAAAIFSPHDYVSHTLPEASAAAHYKMGGTGDPGARHLPRSARPAQPAAPIHYPAEGIDLPQSAKQGTEAIITAVDGSTQTVVTFSQSSLSAQNARASGRLRGNPTFVSVANPGHSKVANHDGRGIAHYARQFWFPQLQAKNDHNYQGQVIEKCAQGDPICDFDISKPIGQIALDYHNIHNGNGKFNYNTVDHNRAIVTKRGNTTYIYYLQPRSNKKPNSHHTTTPTKPSLQIAAQPTQAIKTIEPASASHVTSEPYVAPIATQVQENINSVTQQATEIAPQFEPHINAANQALSQHVDNIAQLIPGLSR